MEEVEVKLRLPSSAAHQRLSELLSPFHRRTHLQSNLFFDTPSARLSSNLAALRLRFYDSDSLCVVSLKSNPLISNGVSRVQEDEEQIDPSLARACVADPSKLATLDSSRVLRRAREEFGCGDEGFLCLGGFRNVRAVYEWKGLRLELDETQFDFGTTYEIECETGEPEEAKRAIEEFLKGNGIDYEYSAVSKFAVFRSGKLP